VNAEFNWWLLVVGVVAGAGLAWLVLGDWSRTEADLDAREHELEAVWIAGAMRDHGLPADPVLVQDILTLNRDYLAIASPVEDWMVEADDVTDLDDDWDTTGRVADEAAGGLWVTDGHRSVREAGAPVRATQPEPVGSNGRMAADYEDKEESP